MQSQNFDNSHRKEDYIKYPYALPNNFNIVQNRSVVPNNEDSRKNLNLEEAILMIKKSIMSEKDDEIFYTILLSQAPSESDKRIIQSIISDERKHNKILKMLYSELSKNNIPESTMSRNNNSSTEYLKNLEKALFGELSAIEKYREIMAVMPDKEKYAILMEILTDEIKHAIKYNFLITKNMK